MIIVPIKYGQMCNQLVLWQHVLASGIAYGHNVLFLRVPKEMIDNFKMKAELPINVFCWNIGILGGIEKIIKGIQKVFRFFRKEISTKEQSDIYTNKIKKKLRKNKIVFVNSWSYRDEENTQIYESKLRDFFSLKKEKMELYSHKFSKLKITGKTTVGIHMRRGDYKVWCDGKYFYNDSVIMNWIKDMKMEKDCQFFLFSNEKISKIFHKENCIRGGYLQ